MNALHLLDASAIERLVDQNPGMVMDIVESAYKIHWERNSVCPESVFLRLPDGNRIIGLPAFVNDGPLSAAGMKWIASFPGNVAKGVERASAVIVLNDLATGFPTAVLEGATISAARTAAFAAIGCRGLFNASSARIAVIGCGRIARTTISYLKHVIQAQEIRIFDLVEKRANDFAALPSISECGGRRVATLQEALEGADVALFATTAAQPYLQEASLLNSCKVVLHVSLRDISEHILSDCYNVTDDRSHAVREQTSLHRLSLLHTEREAVDADLGDVLWGGARPPAEKKVVFSPFGLGVLDVALANQILTKAISDELTTPIQGFYDLARQESRQ